jgi:hypothetical protein
MSRQAKQRKGLYLIHNVQTQLIMTMKLVDVWKHAMFCGLSGMDTSRTEKHSALSMENLGKAGIRRAQLTCSDDPTELRHFTPTPRLCTSSKLGEHVQTSLLQSPGYFAACENFYSPTAATSQRLFRYQDTTLPFRKHAAAETEQRHQSLVKRRMLNDEIRDVRVRQPSRHGQLHDR